MFFLLALVIYCAGQIASRIGGHFGARTHREATRKSQRKAHVEAIVN